MFDLESIDFDELRSLHSPVAVADQNSPTAAVDHHHTMNLGCGGSNSISTVQFAQHFSFLSDSEELDCVCHRTWDLGNRQQVSSSSFSPASSTPPFSNNNPSTSLMQYHQPVFNLYDDVASNNNNTNTNAV